MSKAAVDPVGGQVGVGRQVGWYPSGQLAELAERTWKVTQTFTFGNTLN